METYSVKLIENGTPAVSERFVCELNQCLLTANTAQHAESRVNLNDAFGIPFQAIEEPMPNVKLAGGFDVTLRTMFKEQRCQTRYGKIENASYPISPQMRMDLQAALEWAGSSEQKDTTWINTDKNEVLFAYPSSLPKQPVSFTAIFKQNCDKSIAFSSQAKQFIQELKQTKEIGTDSNAKRITIFVLRKIDKARTKVVYAYEQNRSAIRPDVRIRHAWYIEHKNILGSCPEYLLLDALTPKKLGNINDPSTSWNDYEDKITLPQELLDRVESCVDLVTL